MTGRRVSPEQEAAILRTIKAVVAVKEHVGKKRGINGALPCPCCELGILRFSVSGHNGHTAGICSTEGCCSWQE